MHKLAAVLYPDFELLDLYGPLHPLGNEALLVYSQVARYTEYRRHEDAASNPFGALLNQADAIPGAG